MADHLRAKGYVVLEARTSVEALLLAFDHPFRIDALFTSLAYRKSCNGVALAACLRITRPDMVVFYLGGMEDAGEVTGELARGEAFFLSRNPGVPRLDQAAMLIEAALENPAWVPA